MEIPEPTPADTAALDQLAAQWRDQPEPVRRQVEAAAQQLRDDPSEATAAALMETLRRAGLGDQPRTGG